MTSPINLSATTTDVFTAIFKDAAAVTSQHWLKLPVCVTSVFKNNTQFRKKFKIFLLIKFAWENVFKVQHVKIKQFKVVRN